ncbi:cation-transporting atpase 4 [Diplodia corticola]|uniref:Cation-transporting atpase 4 n=1 Tax=Diplodia corticola TaxID=236234 RepID=A0A1J9S717_9PEZI|nr:cation-transporting atpase 4 [Diplodia corticola]OJD35397.1 cation-transporting atpase 4 [Diplodia corticola]
MFYDAAPKLAAAVIILAIPAFALFGLRCYVRLTSAKWGWDDWMMSVAMPFFLIFTISALKAADSGIGAYDYRTTAAEKVVALKWFYLGQVFFCISIMFAKVSIALQLVRVASQKRPYLVGLWCIVGTIVLSLSFTTIFLLSQCTPITANWLPSTPGAKCLPSLALTVVSFTQSGINIITDWLCAVLPIPLLWDVKMNSNTKMSVVGLLGLGIFASVSAMIRLNYTVSYMNPTDGYLYGVVNLVIWAYAEAGIAVICGCTACLRPLFSSVFRVGSSSDHKDTYALQSRTLRSRSYNGVKLPSVDSRLAHKSVVTTHCSAAGRAGSDDGGGGSGSGSGSVKGDNESQVQILEGVGIHVKYELDTRVQ